MFNLFKSFKSMLENKTQARNDIAKQKDKPKKEYVFEDTVDNFYGRHQYVKECVAKLVIDDNKRPYTPQEILKRKQDRIKTYYDLKDYCDRQGDIGKAWFKDYYQECHNSRNPKFDFIDVLQDDLKDYQDNIDKYIDKYNKTQETLKRANHNIKDEQKQDRLACTYIRVDDRTNIYMNSVNDYISEAGVKCVEFENTLLEYANLYKQNLCPYCNKEIEMPKKTKLCPFCKNRIHVVKGGIRQGNMALKDDDYTKLKSLRDDFNTERQYNSNYDLSVDIKKVYYDK